ncbi:hypothetical protein Lal_00000270 [Lupinus albus]|uniref:Putative transferase n=1 Tax=Lupinus albus TaxID=3870 RepID=A0A6A4NP77_LUPAL|nr:putative transferase [Lupinus albus]KAF1860856.1 hypothetical protein Lal_00000270 [Lupinus albus]
MVDEIRSFFNPKGGCYSRGIRKAIGVPEFDEFLRREAFLDEETKQRLLEEAINEMKVNTCKLAMKQLGRIRRLRNVKRWKIHRLDATSVFRKNGQEANEAWKKLVPEPSAMIVANFLYNSNTTTTTTNGFSGLRISPSQSVIARATC